MNTTQTYRDLIRAVSTQVPRHLEYPLRLRPPSMGDSKESPLVRARKELAHGRTALATTGRGLPVDQAAAKKAQQAMQPSRPPPKDFSSRPKLSSKTKSLAATDAVLAEQRAKTAIALSKYQQNRPLARKFNTQAHAHTHAHPVPRRCMP